MSPPTGQAARAAFVCSPACTTVPAPVKASGVITNIWATFCSSVIEASFVCTAFSRSSVLVFSSASVVSCSVVSLPSSLSAPVFCIASGLELPSFVFASAADEGAPFSCSAIGSGTFSAAVFSCFSTYSPSFFPAKANVKKTRISPAMYHAIFIFLFIFTDVPNLIREICRQILRAVVPYPAVFAGIVEH